MKNLFLVLVILTVLLAVLPSAAHADEVITDGVYTDVVIAETATPTEETTAEEKPVEDTAETATEAPTSHEEQEVVTLLDRILEAWEKGEISTVISLAFDVALIVFAFVMKKASKKNTGKLVGAVATGQTTTVTAMNNLIGAANDVVNAVEGEGGLKGIVEKFQEGINEQIEEIKKIDKEKLEGYGKDLTNCMASVKLLAEMLQTVYANSTTISMPTKNMIAEKYVEICHKLDNTEEKNG